MFLKVAKRVSLSVKVTPHIKIPFADNKLSISGYIAKPYNSIYNIMQCAKNNGFVTCFYTKNNLASYHREYDKNNHFIIPDLLKDSYEIVSVSESGYRIESGKDNEAKTTLAKTADGILYLISNNMTDTNGEKFVMILNLNNKRTLYKKRQEENIYIEWFYPIANVVVPVLRITAEGLFVDLVNLLNDRIDTISCNLECISQLIKELINEYKKSNRDISDTVINIARFYLKSINYEYQAYEGNNYYAKHIVIAFRLNVYGQVYSYDMNNVSLDIKLVDKAISLYLGFDNSRVIIYKSAKSIRSIDISEKKFPLQKHQFDNKPISIKLPNQLYANECYMIYQDKDGFRISGENIQLGGIDVKASLFSYKSYKIFVFALSNNYRRCDDTRFVWEQWTAEGIAIIDTKHNKILVWSYKSAVDGHCMQYSLIGSHYYSSDAQKLVFLSKYSHCFSVINTRGIDTAFDNIVKQQQPECQDKSNRDVYELMESFHIVPMIIDVIAQEHKIPESDISYSNIKIIGSYIDKNFDILYITATYNIDDTKYIGLFMWPIYDDNVRLRLLYYKDVNSKLLYYKPIKSLPTTIYRTITSNMLKIELNNRNTTWVDLHLVYDIDRHIFIDIESNRSSPKILDIYNDFESSTERVSKFDNFLFVKYVKRKQLGIFGELCFIVSDKSMLVWRFPVTYL